VDRLQARGIRAFGPTAAAARLESSKAFAKAFMDRHHIPTGRWSVHEDLASACAAARGPCVVKADGLAAGKGVTVAHSAAEARAAIAAIFGGAFGDAGQRVVVEERLAGPEVSVLALCDGRRALPLAPCRDHKRRFDGDLGPNTGGMGAVCPAPGVDERTLDRVRAEVLEPAVLGMAAEGTPFRGVLYAGLMLTEEGPRVLEFNVRFGDPECQPLMLLLEDDLVGLLLAAAAGDLPDSPPRWRPGAACCVVAAARGYPTAVDTGMPVHGVPEPTEDLVVFFAGTRRGAHGLEVSGGRVLGVTAHGHDLAEARWRAYRALAGIHFDGAGWRADIGGA
jgi:phosphoribosylamine--glycine ligase